MKFWVKAITDDNVQEQLLVNACNVEELALQLGSLLHTHVTCMSVSDFQAQVVEKLNNGADIVTVKITTSKATGSQQEETETSFTPSDARTARTTPGANVISPLSLHFEEESQTLLQNPSFELPLYTRPLTTSCMLLDLPHIDRICLRREDVELLMLPSHNGAYQSVLCGCFVRMRERQDYRLYQILRSVGSMELLLDMIYCEEIRRTEIVSNTPPLLQEVNAWGKKMLTASRSLVTAGFIEAKVGDVSSALRAARVGSDEQHHVHAYVTPAPPTPPSNCMESYGQRHRNAIAILPRMYANVLLGRVELKTNDNLLHAQLCFVEKTAHREFGVVIFASRHTNSERKKSCLSDFSGCMITLGNVGQCTGIVRDRDVTEKGYELFCPPQRWGSHYVSLGQIRPSPDVSHHNDDTDSCTQKFMVLSGRSPTALFDPPTVTTLPIPAWAQMEGTVAHVVRPQVVVHREKLHVFYLLRLTGICLSRRRKPSRCEAADGLSTGIDGNTSCENGRTTDASTASPGAVSRENNTVGVSTVGTCYYCLAHAVSCDDALRTWQVVTTKEPLLSSFSSMPVFTVASVSQPDAARDAESVGGVTSSGSTEKVLQLLWYEDDHVLPKFSFYHQRSPCSTVSLYINLGSRVQLPFERWVNSHETTSQDHWVREPSYSVMRVNAESLRSGVASLSLYEHDGVVVAACVQVDAQRNASVMMLPLTAEP